MYMFSYSTVLILMTKLFPIIATPVLLDNFSIDPSAQLDTDEADPDVGLPLQQTSEDTVSLDQANQNSFGSTIKDLSWLASTAQNDPVAPIPAGAIAKVTTDSTHSCGDATWKRAETKACPAPAATKEEEEQPQCLWGLIPFCCSSINKRGNPTNCLRWGPVFGALPVICLIPAGGIVTCCKYLILEEGYGCLDPVSVPGF